jgi:hypothetical protein
MVTGKCGPSLPSLRAKRSNPEPRVGLWIALLRCSSQRPGENMRSRSRGTFCPSYASTSPPQEKWVQGRPGGRCTRGSRAKIGLRERENHRYRRRHSDLPRAAVYDLYALSSVNHPVCHRRRPRCARHLRQLGARPWGARTTRLRRPQRAPLVSQRVRVHRVPFVTTAIRPLCRGGMQTPYAKSELR